MASSDRSSYINLYSVEDKSDNAYKFFIENKQAKVSVSSQSPLEFNASSYGFKKPDDSVFDLEQRFISLESSTGVSDNAADIASLQQSLAAESNARQSADTSNSNAIVAETNARVAADGDLSNDIAAEASIARAAEQGNSQAITQEISDRVSAVAAESARAQAAEAALGVRIDNVLSNVDPAAQDSLAELLAAYTAADSSLGDSITAALARISTLEAQVAALTDAP